MDEAFDRWVPGSRVAVAMSGGVDSTMAAASLLDAGFEVFGLTAIMTRELSRCCAPEDVAEAARVSAELGFSHETVDVCDAFATGVIDNFAYAYLGGRTPSPCMVCNPLIKFGALLDHALGRGAVALATGHYAQISEADGVFHLHKARDLGKDQSYFLARLQQEQLAHTCLPMGNRLKPEIEADALARGLVARERRESQELCFVPDGDHGGWIDVRYLETPGPGDIVDGAGKVVGRHHGIHHYTVGQRKGLGIALGTPAYVVRLDAEENRVVVGSRDEVVASSCNVDDIAWIAGRPPADTFECRVRVRYAHSEADAVVTVQSTDSATVCFAEPQFAVAPGQGAVFYADDEVLGGGWIGRKDEG